MRFNLERPPTTSRGHGGLQPGGLSVVIEKRHHRARLAVAGEIDLTTGESLVEAVLHAMTADVHVLEIDVSGVAFCGSTGISAFVRLLRTAQEEGKTLRLVNLSSSMERLLSIAGLLEHLTTSPQDVPNGQPPERIDLRSREPAGTRGAGGMGGSEDAR